MQRLWREEKHRIDVSRMAIALVIAVMLTCECTAATVKESHPGKIAFPCKRIGNIDRVRFNEPSGVVFHSQRGTLFVVGDNGDICEIKTDGTMVKQKRIRRADFEGVTYNPATGLLYVAVEGEEKIIELNPDSFEVLREFSIARTFGERTLLKAGGQGIEAITFVPDSNHPEGGTFYVANQSFSLENQEDVSAILEIEVPLKSKSQASGSAKIVKYFCPGVIDLSGLHFDKRTGHLFVISDATNGVFELTTAGELLSSWALPGENQEGIAVDDEGFLYIAQDSGGVIKLKWNRGEQVLPPP